MLLQKSTEMNEMQAQVFIFFYFYFLATPCVTCRILVPQPGIEPGPTAMKALSPNHWTTRELPRPKSLETKPPLHVAVPWLTASLIPCCHHCLAWKVSTAEGNNRWGKKLCHRPKWPCRGNPRISICGSKGKRNASQECISSDTLASETQHKTNKNMYWFTYRKVQESISIRHGWIQGFKLCYQTLVSLSPPLSFVFPWLTVLWHVLSA